MRVPLGASITVGPTPLPHDIAWPRPRAAHFGLSESTPIGDEVYRSVRPYVRGDSRRRVHWKASAHHGSLMVKESDGTGIVTLRIVVQLDAPGAGAEVALARAALCGAAKRWLAVGRPSSSRRNRVPCPFRVGRTSRLAVSLPTGGTVTGDRTDERGHPGGHIRAGRPHHLGHRLLWRRPRGSVGRPHPRRHTRRRPLAMSARPGPPPSRPPETVRAIKTAMQKAALAPASPAGQTACFLQILLAAGLASAWLDNAMVFIVTAVVLGAAIAVGLATPIGGYFVNLSGRRHRFLCVVRHLHRQRLHRHAILRRRSGVGLPRRCVGSDRARLAVGTPAASAHRVQRSRRRGVDRRRRGLGAGRRRRVVRRCVGHVVGARTRRRARRLAARYR